MEMDMDSAAAFLAGSILYAIGLLVILAGTIAANNMIHKYWKSFGWKFFPMLFHEHGQPSRFMTPEEAERIAPTLEKEKK